jgi:hypothetical protein
MFKRVLIHIRWGLRNQFKVITSWGESKYGNKNNVPYQMGIYQIAERLLRFNEGSGQRRYLLAGIANCSDIATCSDVTNCSVSYPR